MKGIGHCNIVIYNKYMVFMQVFGTDFPWNLLCDERDKVVFSHVNVTSAPHLRLGAVVWRINQVIGGLKLLVPSPDLLGEERKMN